VKNRESEITDVTHEPVILGRESSHVPPVIEMMEVDTAEVKTEMNFGELLRATESEVPKVDSISNALLQAIQLKDGPQIRKLMKSNHTNTDFVNTTVNRLPSTVVMPFLQFIVETIRATPKNPQYLVVWLRSLLTCHVAYLTTAPDLVKNLADLYTTLDSRVSKYDDLLKLSGRLDVTYSRINAKKKDEVAPNTGKPLNTFIEE